MKDLVYDAQGIHCPRAVRAERNAARVALAFGAEVDTETRDRLGALLYVFESDRNKLVNQARPNIVDELESELFVRMLLEKLPVEDAAAFSLIFICDYSYAEAAEILGLSDAKLRSRLRAAKRVLKSELLAA